MNLLDRVQRLSQFKQRRAEQQRRLAAAEIARERGLRSQAEQERRMVSHLMHLATLDGQAGLNRQRFYARLRQAAVARAQASEQLRQADVHRQQAQQAHHDAAMAVDRARGHERTKRKVDHWKAFQQRRLARQAQVREQDQVQEDFVCQHRFR
jgi:hypothetical protein